MNKDKSPLSKAVGNWDNGFSDSQSIEYTKDQIERAFRSNNRYSSMLREGRLQLNLRGAERKNHTTADSDDVDVHAAFLTEIDPNKEKHKVFCTMKDFFGAEYVKRHAKSIVILPKSKRLKVDLIVCRQEDGCITVWNDLRSCAENFYPTLDSSNIGELNKRCGGNYSQMVRAFKTARNKVVAEHAGEYHIPSHFIECILYAAGHKIYRKEYDSDPEQNNRKRFIAVEQSVREVLFGTDKILEINGKKPLFSTKYERNTARRFWNDLHEYLTENYDFCN